MIRIPSHCPVKTLPGLLDESLGAEETQRVSEHLNTCPACRHRLERLAAEASVWDQTRAALSSLATVTDSSADQHLARLLPTLESSDATDSLGRLGEYEITELVGWGGMGVVLKARDVTLSRTVAIKVLHPHLAAGGASRRRFSREARAAAAVVHPNVVPIHSVRADHSPPYLVMAYVPGGTLQDRIDREGPLSLEETLRVALQIAEGLAAAHRQGVVHRDIKPGNILLDHGQERVCLSDFGLAQAIDDASQTCSGMLAGTPQYMSPEQARGDSVDARSDLFSLGGVMYAMLTGRPPFRAPSTLAVLKRIQTESPKPIDSIQPQTPVWVQRLVDRFLSKSSEARIASADEAVELLRKALAHTASPQHHRLPESLIDTGRSRSRNRRGVFLVTGLAVALSASLAGRWLTAPDESKHVSAPETPPPPPPPPSAPATSASEAVARAIALEEQTRWDDGLEPIVSALSQAIEELDLMTSTPEPGEDDAE